MIDNKDLQHRKMSGTKDFVRLIKKALKEGSPILSWVTFDGKKQIKRVQVTSLSIPKKIISVKIPGIENEFKSSIIESQVLNFFISSNACIFKLNLSSANADQFNFELPENFLRLERRKHLRLYCQKAGYVPNVSMSRIDLKLVEKKYIKECNDFSSSGFSINVNPVQSYDFEVGDYFREVTIEHAQFNIIASACLIYKEKDTKGNNPIDNWRLGFEFLNVTPKQKFQIEKFIIKHTEPEA